MPAPAVTWPVSQVFEPWEVARCCKAEQGIARQSKAEHLVQGRLWKAHGKCAVERGAGKEWEYGGFAIFGVPYWGA